MTKAKLAKIQSGTNPYFVSGNVYMVIGGPYYVENIALRKACPQNWTLWESIMEAGELFTVLELCCESGERLIMEVLWKESVWSMLLLPDTYFADVPVTQEFVRIC